MPNQPDAVNPAIAPQFKAGRLWRGVTDPHRWAEEQSQCLPANRIWNLLSQLLA